MMKDQNKTKKQLIKELEALGQEVNRPEIVEAEYSFLLESLTEGVIIIDQAWRYLSINDEVARMVQMPKEELVGNKMTDLFPGVEESVFGRTYTQVLETGERATADDVFTFPDGRKVWYEVQVYPIPVGLLIIVADITKHKQAEEALRESEEKYRLLFENMMNGFALHEIVLNEKGKPVDYVFLEVNSAFKRLTGLKHKNIIGKKVTEILPGIEKDPADWIGIYGKVTLTGQEIRLIQHAQPLGKWYSVLAFSPRKGQFATIFEDITERKRAEEELEKHHEHLEELVDERTKELRTTVNVMAGREVRMAELKDVIKQLREQLEKAGMAPVADDQLVEIGDHV